MRTGIDYLEALRDGRVADVTTHPATAAMVQQYVAWYDRHADPARQDILLTPPDANAKASRCPF